MASYKPLHRTNASVAARPLTAAERSKLSGIFSPTPRGRDNVSARDLQHLEAMAAEGLLEQALAVRVRTRAQVEKKLEAIRKAVDPLRKRREELDPPLDAFVETTPFKDFASGKRRERGREQLVAREEKLRAFSPESVVAAGTDPALAALVAKLVARELKKVERAKATPRKNPGVTGLALALPNPAGEDAPWPDLDDIRRTNMAKRKPNRAQLAALARGRAVRTASLAARDNISEKRFKELQAAGLASNVTPPTAEMLRAFAARLPEKQRKSAHQVTDKNKKVRTVYPRYARYLAAADSPAEWAMVSHPERLGLSFVAPTAADREHIRRRIAAEAAKLAKTKQTEDVAPKFTYEEAFAALKRAGVYSERRTRREALQLSKPHKKVTQRGVTAKTRARTEARLAYLRGLEDAERIPARLRAPTKAQQEAQAWIKAGLFKETAKAGAAKARAAKAAKTAARNNRGHYLKKHRDNPRSNGLMDDLMGSVRQGSFWAGAGGGLAGFFLLSSLVRKVAPGTGTGDAIVRWGVPAAGVGLLWWNPLGLSKPVRLGVGVGLVLAAVLRDALAGLLSKLPVVGKFFEAGAAKAPEGFGNLYDAAFEEGTDGLGRYLATEGLGADVYAAPAGTGASVYAAPAGYLTEANPSLAGLGVDVRAALADGGGFGRYVATQGLGDGSTEDVAFEGVGDQPSGDIEAGQGSQVEISDQVGRNVVPRGVFGESVFGPLNAVLEAVPS